MDGFPLGGRAYPSIPHLPGSRTGPADRHVTDGQARLCTVGKSGRNDTVLVQEKLDGSCVAAARIADEIVALGREGRLASASPNPARQLWADWVDDHADRFLAVLQPGERLIGEWLALAHSTRYELIHEPFVCFDLIVPGRPFERLPYDDLVRRVAPGGFVLPGLVHRGAPIDVPDALEALGNGCHGALDPVEGAVWRVERKSEGTVRVILVAKFVKPGKVDGSLLPENTGKPAIWNWHPTRS